MPLRHFINYSFFVLLARIIFFMFSLGMGEEREIKIECVIKKRVFFRTSLSKTCLVGSVGSKRRYQIFQMRTCVRVVLELQATVGYNGKS